MVARAGLPFGLVLALTSTARLLSALTFPPLILLYYVGVIVIPIVAYRSAPSASPKALATPS